MQFVYAVLFSILGTTPDGSLILQQQGLPVQVTINECLKQAQEINFPVEGVAQAVMLCTPLASTPAV